ncbi:MAG: ATPase, partial [Bacteroidaceae bacterium]
MKKLSLLLFHKEYKETLKGLRELGVVHIHEDKKRSGKDDSLQAKLRIIKKIGELEIKFSYLPEKGDKEKVSSSDEKLLETLEGYFKKKEKLNQDLAYYKKNVSIYEPWGELDKTRISGLLKAGWTLRFFTVPDRKYKKEWETKYNAIIVNEDRGIKFFTTLTHNDDKMEIDADSFVFPKESLSETLVKVDTLTKEIAEQQEFIVQVAIDALKRLDIYRTSLLASTDELKIDDAAVSLVEDKVMALEGWIPVDTEQEVIEYCKSKKLYYDITKPTAKDEVPVKLKNNSFARLFEPITEMYSLPNYKELDPTPYFAPFYMLFFGLCMG